MTATATIVEHAARMLRATPAGRPRALVPAAMRVERTRFRVGRGASVQQTALTLWFGEGPALPLPSAPGRAVRVVTGAAVTVLGAAALGALGAIASQQGQARLAARGGAAPRLTG